jgi:hypothetical protein
MKSVMHMRVARSFLLVLLAYYFIGDAKAASMSVVVGTFALACMNHVDEPSGMSELNKGGVKLPPEQADPLLKPEHGSAYLHGFDNGGRMIVAMKDAGGCKITSMEASRHDVEEMILETFRRAPIPNRLLGSEKDKQLLRTTYAVSYRGKRLFLVVFGPDGPGSAGVNVEVFPAGHPPANVRPEATIDWPT